MRGYNFTPKSAGLVVGPTSSQHPTLFQPSIVTSRSPAVECDYNLHKSNSTYFADLDVARLHHSMLLFQEGVKKMQRTPQNIIGPDGKPAKGELFMIMGAVHCNFKREIKPYEKFEMWTRLLCWDRKWFYFVTHFVKTGALKPNGFSLDNPSGLPTTKSKKGLSTNIPDKIIFASAISKFVGKIGRLTVHPEAVIEASGLLPPKPGGWNTMSAYESSTKEADWNKWDWKRIEAENEKGLVFVRNFAALESLNDDISGGDRPAIGSYSDLF